MGWALGVVRGVQGPTWPLGRWVRWPVTPTGTGAGSSLLCPSSVPVAGGWWLRPRVFSAHLGRCRCYRSSKYIVHAPAWGVTPHPLAKRFQTGRGFLLQAIFTIWPDLVPIQTGAPA
jgi:hypothetical protein